MAQNKHLPSESEIGQRIRDILEAIKSPEHADDIIELRKIFRKNVPFFFRSYFAAYLLKESLSSGFKGGQRNQGKNRDTTRENQNRDQKKPKGGNSPEKSASGRPQAQQDEQKAKEKRNERMPPLPEGVETATLFVSAGRKRHFYPRHLLELFAGADIPRESIGEIRLFDNYTFVQIIAEDAEQAVSRLDGQNFKGRKLTVNFARKKEDSLNSDDSAPGAESAMDDDSVYDDESRSKISPRDDEDLDADSDGQSRSGYGSDDDLDDDLDADESQDDLDDDTSSGAWDNDDEIDEDSDDAEQDDLERDKDQDA